jgi:hypothetical protein
MPTLAELKALVKGHSTDKPKMSAGKEALLLYAEKCGLLKKPEAAKEPELKVTEIKAPKVAKMKKEDVLPPELKKPMPKSKVEKVAKVEAVEAPPAKKSSSFASFMSEHKGQGLSMKQLAELYKQSK